jgi:hypothetical protein
MPASSIFTKPVNEITFQDVSDFCDAQHQEGAHLDYKLDVARDKIGFAKTISAIANTLGGTIIMGVVDQNDLPVIPIEGHNFPGNARNNIEEVIYAYIQPPVFVEVSDVLPNPHKAGYGVVVIRIPQSLLAPHVMHKQKAIFVRTGQASRPEELIDPEQLPWLYDLRHKSVRLKENLIEASCDRFRRFRNRALQEDAPTYAAAEYISRIGAEQHIWMAPAYR